MKRREKLTRRWLGSNRKLDLLGKTIEEVRESGNPFSKAIKDPQVAEEEVEEARTQFEAVANLMGLKAKANLVRHETVFGICWDLVCNINVPDVGIHSNRIPMYIADGNSRVNFIEPTVKRVFGDLGRALLDVVRGRDA